MQRREERDLPDCRLRLSYRGTLSMFPGGSPVYLSPVTTLRCCQDPPLAPTCTARPSTEERRLPLVHCDIWRLEPQISNPPSHCAVEKPGEHGSCMVWYFVMWGRTGESLPGSSDGFRSPFNNPALKVLTSFQILLPAPAAHPKLATEMPWWHERPLRSYYI